MMARTRDLVLIVITTWFLLLLISVTVWMEDETSNTSTTAFLEDYVPATEYNAVLTAPDETSSQDTIATWKQKLANYDGDIVPSPSVEEERAETAPEYTQGSLKRCAYPDDVLGYVAQFPSGTATWSLREGARILSTTGQYAVPATSSTTESRMETVEKVWLQLPQSPAALAQEACVPSAVIGVTTGGALLFNNAATAYQSTPAETLIGYARDGNPIYGFYEGETDSCGGYAHATGYRYVITESTNILNCFKATPQDFNW